MSSTIYAIFNGPLPNDFFINNAIVSSGHMRETWGHLFVLFDLVFTQIGCKRTIDFSIHVDCKYYEVTKQDRGENGTLRNRWRETATQPPFVIFLVLPAYRK